MKALIFHGSPYDFDSFVTLKNFDTECLHSYNTGLLAHYFYYITSKDADIDIVVDLAAKHACKSGTMRGIKGTQGYIYVAKIGLGKFLVTNEKVNLDFLIEKFPMYKEQLSKYYDSFKNNKEIFQNITKWLLKVYDNDKTAEFLAATGYRGLREPMDALCISTLYIWDNNFVTENKIVTKSIVKRTSKGYEYFEE